MEVINKNTIRVKSKLRPASLVILQEKNFKAISCEGDTNFLFSNNEEDCY